MKRSLTSIIEQHKGSIAWYPSADADFRDIMYLSEAYYDLKGIKGITEPSLFIHSDYQPHLRFEEGEVHNYRNTSILFKHVEELRKIKFSSHPKEIINNEPDQDLYGRVILIKLEINSKKLGVIEKDLIYIIAENEALFGDYFLKKKTEISHLIRVRYGGGCGGGGHSKGTWLENAVSILNTKYFIANKAEEEGEGDRSAKQLYPVLNKEIELEKELIYTIPSDSWSEYGEVEIWYNK